MEIFDDIIPVWYQNALEDTFLGGNVPWKFLERINENDIPMNIQGAEISNNLSALSHLMFFNGRPTSEYYHLVLPLMYSIEQMTGRMPREILKIKSGMVFSNSRELIGTPHADTDIPHNTFLYYVNDSDGDTYFFDRFIGDDIDGMKVVNRVSPKRGRAVIFDGQQYHSTGYPVYTRQRAFINVNYTL